MTRFGLLLLCFLFVAGLTLAQQAPPTTVTVEGIAFDAVTDRPLPSVQVQMGNLRRTTNAQGQFSFESVATGPQTLIATKDNYMIARTEKRSAPVDGVRLTLAPGQLLSGLKLYLYPAGVATGQVVDSKGLPLRDAEVVSLRYGYDTNGALVPVQAANPRIVSTSSDVMGAVVAMGLSMEPSPGRVRIARTNDRGEFRIFNLDPGQYLFYVRMPVSAAAPVYFPGVVEPRSAGRVVIDGGVEARLGTITVPSASAVRVRFKITDQSGERNPDSFVLVRARGAVEAMRMQGESALLQPGSYEAEAILGSPAPFPFSLAAGRASFEVRDRDLEVEVTVPRSGALVGSIRSSQPVPKLRVVLESDEALRGLAVGLTSDPEGKFALAGIPAGLFQLRAVEGIPPGKCVAEFLQYDNGRNVLRDGLRSGGSLTSFQLTLSEGQQPIVGKVSDATGQPAVGAFVALLSDERAQRHLSATAVTDQLGNFEIPCVQSGAYHAYAWRAMDGAAYRNADFMKEYNERGKPVRIENSRSELLNLSVLER